MGPVVIKRDGCRAPFNGMRIVEAVAKAAPAIPILSGNISTQSITILKRLLITVAAIAIDGAPSFLTNALQM